MLLRVAESGAAGESGRWPRAVRAVAARASGARAGWLLAGLGAVGAGAAAVAAPAAAGQAAAQDWPPFVLVAGLLLTGLVAGRDGLFAAAGQQAARLARGGGTLLAGAVLLIGLVTATLNLDTSVAFLTPVLIYTARARGAGEAALLYGCVLLSNAGSLLLPGSNLTNLIVLGPLHLSGAQFLARMWLPALAALASTAAVIAVAERDSLRVGQPGSAPVAAPLAGDVADSAGPAGRPVLGVGLVAVAVSTVLVIAVPAPAIPVAVTGVAAVAVRVARRRLPVADAVGVLGLPVLAGLLGVAIALGTLGRTWAGLAAAQAHLGTVATAALAAVLSVAVNNLPAASLLAARPPPHPYALLLGLNLGPNLFVTGSLAWILWLRAARAAGARPSVRRACRAGLVAVPLSLAAALAALMVTGAH